ncbi:pyrroline-5-carboxylate reductase [Kordiimonas gwangyangensis]|uniref:pyrroline-5-carboxylate reductase n=1 Tax=Kordiimonas gwangyangensis TaxID=288022 RepID=UPI00035FE273|nr:pyrroline-5-carboxylate reductase [Kordiimonas gwangyangensis]
MQGFSSEKPLLLMGCGRMGHAMAMGWLRAGLAPEHLYVVDPAAPPSCLPNMAEGHFVTNAHALPNGLKARVIIVAVKPQVIGGILPLLTPFADEGTLVISVAAGVPLSMLEDGVAVDATYVRAMPNTPAAIGAGITGLTARDDISVADKALARELLHAVGETVWIADEAQMNAVTAVSGSGPAYVFHLVECMAHAGAELGLSPDVAMQLARQTVIGAARLMDEETEVSASELRRQVTSPGGTTEAALKVLGHSETGLADLMMRALAAAEQRGVELGG